MTDAALHVMAIVDEPPTMQLMASVFEGAGDDLVIATDLAEGLARAAAEVPEVVFIDVALGNGAGLALVHHLRAVSPTVSVYALAREDSLELGSKVMALGGAGVLTMPLTGDELLTAVGDVRMRRAEKEERVSLEREARAVRRGAILVTKAAEIADAADRSEAAERMASVFEEATGAKTTMVYVPAGEGSTQLMRAGARGDVGQAPSFCEEMDLHNHARASHLDVVPLTLKKKSSGLVVLGSPRTPLHESGNLLELLACQAATTMALVQEREQSHRGAMKDPNSSAYTFAYFVDVAGREIDKARRHRRRFALATIVFDNEAQDQNSRVIDGAWEADRQDVGTVEMAERLLAAVRDTDVLARVDDDEFYLLLPETGGSGAHTLRRRVLSQTIGSDGRRTGGRDGLEFAMGCATYPHDGTDLSRLLRVAKQRVEALQKSVVRRFDLDVQPLGEITDVLLLRAGDLEREDGGFETPRSIELPTMDFIAVGSAAVADAIRSGEAHIVATERAGMSLGSAVRTLLSGEPEGVNFRTVDVTGVAECRDIEALTIVCEHGAYALLGRTDGSIVRAVHAADPLLADLVTQRLGDAVGERLLD